MFAVLPTLLTLGNAACGFGAITFAAKVGPQIPAENHLVIAALLIFLAMVFDMLDGSVARLTDQTSEFGDLCRARLGELIALYLTDLVTADRRTDLVELLSGVVDGYRHHFDPNDPNDIPPAR